MQHTHHCAASIARYVQAFVWMVDLYQHGFSDSQVAQLLEPGEPLVREYLAVYRHQKGYFFDQGMRPTHKAEIIALYEAGLDEAEIARRSQHTPASVGHYSRHYEK